MPYICQCGCGQEIPPRKGHNKTPPRYILAHYLKLGTSSRIEKSRLAHLALRTKPPDDWMSPSGLCECGCGEKTKIANVTKAERGQYNGYPLRFVNNHHVRNLPPEKTSRWKGGKYYDKQGYLLVYRPDWPTAHKDGYIPAHRLIYEETRGVHLTSRVLVHHINGDRMDNRPENLVATVGHIGHQRVHRQAGELISVFLDDKLLERTKAYVREHGELPDLEEVTRQVYGSPGPE